MSSELKGPLGDISYKDYVADISKSGRHLLGLIDKVLDLVRAEDGTVLIDIAETNVAFIAKSVARMMATDADGAGVHLSVAIDSDPLTILTDGGKLREILTSLVSNGIKFTQPGGAVTIGVERSGDGATLTVADNGIGMREEDLPAAIAPFGQIENVYARSRGGVGLGLPFARRLTELLDGTFRITSEPGTGTTIAITLPGRPSNLPANDIGRPEAPRSQAIH
jgi:two-component system cell cycle sensor histidine kinase PleC